IILKHFTGSLIGGRSVRGGGGCGAASSLSPHNSLWAPSRSPSENRSAANGECVRQSLPGGSCAPDPGVERLGRPGRHEANLACEYLSEHALCCSCSGSKALGRPSSPDRRFVSYPGYSRSSGPQRCQAGGG